MNPRLVLAARTHSGSPSAGAVLGALAFAVASCGGDAGSPTGTTTTPPSPAHVARVVLKPSNAWLFVGGTAALTATPVDDGGKNLTGRTVTWSSFAPALATVSTDGSIFAVGASGFGTSTQAMAIVTASVEGKTASATVAVTAADVPAITSLSISPSVIVRGAGRVPVTVSAHVISPSFAEIAPFIRFVAPGNDPVYEQSCETHLVSGTTNDGQWSCTISWPDDLAGRYELNTIVAVNGVSPVRQVTYQSPAARALGFAAGLTVVTSAADTTPPALVDFAVIPASSTVALAPSTVFIARATDAGIGIDRIIIDMGEPTGDVGAGNLPKCTTTNTSSDARDVSWTCVPSQFPFSRTGSYPIRSVMLIDRSGNTRSYTNPQLLEAGFGAGFTVVP